MSVHPSTTADPALDLLTQLAEAPADEVCELTDDGEGDAMADLDQALKDTADTEPERDMLRSGDASGTAAAMIKEAVSFEGYREVPENYTEFNRWFGPIAKNPPYPNNGYGYPWCHSFLTYCLYHSHNDGNGPRTAGCEAGVDWFEQQHRFHSQPMVGDFVYYWRTDSHGRRAPGHVELVVALGDDALRTVGGNTSGRLRGRFYDGDGVYLKWVSRRSDIVGYGRPTYRPGSLSDDPSIEPGDLIRATHDHTVYLIDRNRRRRAIPDSATFEAKWRWTQVRVVPSDELAAIPAGPNFPALDTPVHNGDLIRSFQSHNVYLVEHGKRRGLDAATFHAHWHSYEVRVLAPERVISVPLGQPYRS